jgi:acetyl-CoA synthetase
MAAGNDQPALWIVEDSGEERRFSFAQMSARSNQVANWLRELGVQRGDRALVMLGNEVALWETMLATIKLGTVLIPCSNLLTPEDLRDRMTRGEVRHYSRRVLCCFDFHRLKSQPDQCCETR